MRAIGACDSVLCFRAKDTSNAFSVMMRCNGDCGQQWGPSRLHKADVAEFKAGRIRRLYCKTCVQTNNAKERKLRNQWRYSKKNRANARVRYTMRSVLCHGTVSDQNLITVWTSLAESKQNGWANDQSRREHTATSKDVRQLWCASWSDQPQYRSLAR